MTELQLAKRIAKIVVYGHIWLFIYGVLVMLIGPYERIDTFQMVLMGSPLLAMVGIAAFRFMSALPKSDTSGPADQDWAKMATITTWIFIILLFASYTVAIFNVALPIGVLKLIVGAIETVMGAYLGVIRDTMFPEVPKQP